MFLFVVVVVVVFLFIDERITHRGGFSGDKLFVDKGAISSDTAHVWIVLTRFIPNLDV